MNFNSLFRNIVKDSFLYGLAPVFVKVLNLILLPLYATILSPSDFGNQLIFTIIYSILLPFFNVGLDGAILRFYLDNECENIKSEYLSTGFYLKIALILFLLPILFSSWGMITELASNPSLKSESILILMSIILIGDGLGNQLAAKQKAERKILVITKIQLFSELTGVLMILCSLYYFERSFMALLYGQAISSVIKFSGFFKISISDISYHRINLQKAKRLLQYGIPMLPHKIQSKALEFVIVIVLNKYIGLSNTGYYSMAKKILSPFSLGAEYLNKALIPIKLKNLKSNSVELRKALKKFGLIILGFYPIILILGFILINYVLGEEWQKTEFFMFFASLPILTQAFYYLLNTGIELSPKQYIIPIGSFLSSLISIALIVTITRDYNIHTLFIVQSLYFIMLSLIIRTESKKYFKFYE